MEATPPLLYGTIAGHSLARAMLVSVARTE
jgi:hypothetical protein